MEELPGRMQDYLSWLDAVRGLSPAAVAGYSYDLLHYAEYCKDTGIEPENASRQEVTMFIGYLTDQGLEASSINRALSAVRGFYKYLVKIEARQDNPAERLKNLKTPKTLPVFLWEKEMAEYAALPEQSERLWPERDRALILCIYSAGLRVSEAAGLSVDKLERGFHGARVIGKGDKERQVFFSQECVEALREWLPVRKAALRGADTPTPPCPPLKGGEIASFPPPLGGGPALFINQRGGALTVRGMYYIVHE
jgi:site-specific recombinase XerD